MNIKQAQALKHGDILHYIGGSTNCVKTRKDEPIVVSRFRVTGQAQIWKRDPYKVRVPVKHGLYKHSVVTHENLDDWHLEGDCPLLRQPLETESQDAVEIDDGATQ